MFVPGKSLFSDIGCACLASKSSDDGRAWRALADLPVNAVPTTVSFAPVTARTFRVVFTPAPAPAYKREPAPGVAGDGILAAFEGAANQPIKVSELRLSSEAKVDRYESKAGFAIERDYYALSTEVDEPGVAPSKVIDLTRYTKPDGTLDWTPPRGHVARPASGLFAARHDQSSGHRRSDRARGRQVRRRRRAQLPAKPISACIATPSGADLIGQRGVRALLTDSIEVGAANWTPRMIEQFKRLRGYDPTPWLPALTGAIIGSRSASDAFLYDFRRTLADLMASEHYGTVAAVAHEHGLKVYGEALEDDRPSLGDDMAMRRMPTCRWRRCGPISATSGPKPTYLADIKGAASVAHIYGQNLVAAESLTSMLSPWAHAPADLRRVIDLEFVTGVNRPVIHTSVHQPVDDKVPGLSLFIFGQYFNRHETWAEMARPWVDYISRNSFLLQQGRNCRRCRLFLRRGSAADRAVRREADRRCADALRLRLRQRGCTAESAERRGRRTRCEGRRALQRALPRRLEPADDAATLQQIASLAEAGATIVGVAPESSPSRNHDQAAFDALVHEAVEWRAGHESRQGSSDRKQGRRGGAGVFGHRSGFHSREAAGGYRSLFLHRRSGDGDIYFLNNRKNRAETLRSALPRHRQSAGDLAR